MSYRKFISEILAAQADQMPEKLNTSEDYVTLFPNEPELHELLYLADHVNNALHSVEPSAPFREQLYQDLIATAQRTLTEPQPTSYGLHTLRSPIISIPLTMVITLLVGFFWRRRRQKETELVPVLPQQQTRMD
ncbi:MAG: hypothetical protein AAF629_26955 [Chloroflexota bacterium]